MEVGSANTRVVANELDAFLNLVNAIKEDMKTMEKHGQKLQEYNEDTRNIHDKTIMKKLQSIIASEMDMVLTLAKAIMKRLETLGRYSTAERKVFGLMSSLEKTKMSVVAGLGKKLRDIMEEFQGLRAKMAAGYKETIEYQYLTLTGEKKCIENIENLITTGEIEQLISEEVEAQGRGNIVDILDDIHLRHKVAKYMQKHLSDLHQLLLNMVSVVEAQGQRMIHEQQQMTQGNSFIKPGPAQLQDSWHHEKDAKKRGIIALILTIVLIIILIFPLFQSESDNGRE